MTDITIGATTAADAASILDIHWAAFAEDSIQGLVRDLMADASAEPLISLLARDGGVAVGHVFFSRAPLVTAGGVVPAMLLAPLAVRPEAQGRGIGRALIRAGLDRAAAAGFSLAFVLGHPGYYPRCGFRPAGCLGFDAPYEIPPENADAWMVTATGGAELPTTPGRVRCAAALDRAEYWRE